MVFIAHVLLFMLAMIQYMVTVGTLYLMIGWEYLGLMSYVLIQH